MTVLDLISPVPLAVRLRFFSRPIVDSLYTCLKALALHKIKPSANVEGGAGKTIVDHGFDMSLYPDPRNHDIVVWIGTAKVWVLFDAICHSEIPHPGDRAVYDNNIVIMKLDVHVFRTDLLWCPASKPSSVYSTLPSKVVTQFGKAFVCIAAKCLNLTDISGDFTSLPVRWDSKACTPLIKSSMQYSPHWLPTACEMMFTYVRFNKMLG